MSLNFTWKPLAGLFAFALVTACSTVPRHKESDVQTGLYQARADQLLTYETWELEGRLAVNDGKDGGSGNFKWIHRPDSTHMDFHGALGRGAWRLDADDQGARLEMANGETAQAATVGKLARKQLGWQIPVDALEWWVRGIEAPGGSPNRELDEQGALVRLSQFGWDIQFERYSDSDKIMMPYKMTARRQDQTVKLAVRRWFLSASDDERE